jgi:formylglycine-generating enzyme required for sulfatase activity
MVTVQGGTLVTTNELNGAVVSTFEIGKYEVTWAEWQDVRDWAVANGYSDLAGVGAGSAGDNPVRDVIWYNVVKWINAKSERHGFVPVYRAGGEVYRSGQSVPDLQNGANGYRLPSEVEWEWAARGGLSSQSYTYSGSTDANAVAWTAENSSGAAVNLNNGRGTWSVGLKAHNELGISDMSGNVWEWCQDLVGSGRRIRGGSWNSGAVYAVVAYRGLSRNPNQNNYDVGFRLARSSEL